MDDGLFKGKLVRLCAHDPEKDSQTEAGWDRDTVYSRWLAVEPVTPPNPRAKREHMEDAPKPTSFHFAIRTLSEEQAIGFVILFRVNFTHGDAWVGIGIGETKDRGKGYGTDAMRVILRYAFQELNLHRVSLDAVATNAQAIRSYVKCGFVHEGQTRGTEYRNRRRDNLVSMGILREEWEAKVASSMQYGQLHLLPNTFDNYE